MNNSELRHAMYGIRTLVFQETEPQSNKYNQIILSADQFKAVSFNLGKFTGKKAYGGEVEEMEMILSKEEYVLPDLRETDE